MHIDPVRPALKDLSAQLKVDLPLPHHAKHAHTPTTYSCVFSLLTPLPCLSAHQRLHSVNADRLSELESRLQAALQQQRDWVVDKSELLAQLDRRDHDIARLHIRLDEQRSKEAALTQQMQSAQRTLPSPVQRVASRWCLSVSLTVSSMVRVWGRTYHGEVVDLREECSRAVFLMERRCCELQVEADDAREAAERERCAAEALQHEVTSVNQRLDALAQTMEQRDAEIDESAARDSHAPHSPPFGASVSPTLATVPFVCDQPQGADRGPAAARIPLHVGHRRAVR